MGRQPGQLAGVHSPEEPTGLQLGILVGTMAMAVPVATGTDAKCNWHRPQEGLRAVLRKEGSTREAAVDVTLPSSVPCWACRVLLSACQARPPQPGPSLLLPPRQQLQWVSG